MLFKTLSQATLISSLLSSALGAPMDQSPSSPLIARDDDSGCTTFKEISDIGYIPNQQFYVVNHYPYGGYARWLSKNSGWAAITVNSFSIDDGLYQTCYDFWIEDCVDVTFHIADNELFEGNFEVKMRGQGAYVRAKTLYPLCVTTNLPPHSDSYVYAAAVFEGTDLDSVESSLVASKFGTTKQTFQLTDTTTEGTGDFGRN